MVIERCDPKVSGSVLGLDRYIRRVNTILCIHYYQKIPEKNNRLRSVKACLLFLCLAGHRTYLDVEIDSNRRSIKSFAN